MFYLPKTFCLCHELKTGGITIGWAGVIMYVLMCGNFITSEGIDQESLIGGVSGMLLAGISNGLLIYGSKKSNWMCIVPWLLLTPIPLSLAILAIMRSIKILKYAEEIRNDFFKEDFMHTINTYIAILAIYLCVTIYCWLCVLSLLQQIKENVSIQDSDDNGDALLKETDEEVGLFIVPMEKE